MQLYYTTTPENACAIMQHGFQEHDVHYWGVGVQLYDVRPGPGGCAWRASRHVDVQDEGVQVTPGPMLLMSFPDGGRWLRVHLDLADDEINAFKVEEEDTPQGLSDEEITARIDGDVPWAGTIDWGYGEYMIPLDVLRVHARVEGPFTYDAETEDERLETNVSPGIDFHVRLEEEAPDA
jgi:hypothetical protein